MFRNLVPPSIQLLTEIIILALMLCHAPIPVGHRHGDSELRGSVQEMELHLQKHHGGIANAENWPDDWHWHWHWVFPGESCVDLGCESTIASNTYLTPSEQIVACEAGCLSICLYFISDHMNSLARIPERCRYSFQYIALLHSSQSLPELLGIMRL